MTNTVTNLSISPQAEAAMVLWRRVFGDGVMPPARDFEIWLAKYDEANVRRAITVTAMKDSRLGGMDLLYRTRFAAKVMATRAQQEAKQEGAAQ